MIKIKNEGYLKEGPGAGYTIKYEITNIDNIKIKSQKSVDDDIIEIECDISAEAYTEFESYDYSGELTNVPIKITDIAIEKLFDTTEEFDSDDIYAALEGIKAKSLQGGGWSHSTYDGDIFAQGNSIKDTDNGYFIYKINGYITDDEIIDYIDKVVAGDAQQTIYVAYDGDDVVKDFDNEKEAIEFAEENNCTNVTMVIFEESFDGSLEEAYSETVWHRW